MNNIAYRPYRLTSIPDLLKSVAEQPPQIKGKNGIGVTGLKSQFQKTRTSFNGQAIELVVSPSTGSSRLYKFYTQLEEKLHNLGSDGFISYVRHSQNSGTTFTVKLTSPKNKEFLEALNNMTEVKEVKEESNGGSAYPNFPRKFNVWLAR